MAQEVINIGAIADDGTGDTIRGAGIKINANFTELYADPLVDTTLGFNQNEISSTESNADIVLKPSGTGSVLFPAIRINDNNIEGTRSNDDLKFIPNGSGKLIIDGLGFSGTSITATDSTLININENLSVDGDFTNNSNTINTGVMNAGTGSTIGNLTLANGSITDSSGDISFGNENITTTGTLAVATGSTIGNLTLANGSITDSSGDISFGNENITTTGNFNAGVTTLGSLTVSGASSFVGTTTVDNLTFNDNIIGTSSNADLNLTPGGTGVVNVSNLTIDSSINLTDNVIKVTRSNDDLVLSGNGTGSVQISKIDMDQGTVDNTVIGATTPAAGTFSTVSFTDTQVNAGQLNIKDNQITVNTTNGDLEISASGSGNVTVDGYSFPNSFTAGRFIKTDGSKQLSLTTFPILFIDSDVQDNSTTISFSPLSEIDHVTAVGQHNRIESTTVIQDSWTTSKYDSAWYLAVNRDDNTGEFAVKKHSVVHNNSDAFVSTVGANTGATDHLTTTADVNLGSVRLLTSSSSSTGSTSFYRIGLGDDDSTGYAGEDEAAVVINTDVDSATEVLDSWAHANYRGAKYYISVNNASKTELTNIEANVVHNGSDAYITSYNVVNTGDHALVTLTAAINGANVELSVAGLETDLRVHAYRILLSDSEADRSSTNINVIGNVTVSSATTTLDTFDTGSYQAAHYVIVSHNSSEGHSGITEAMVVSDGTNAFITQHGTVSSKGTPQLILTVAHSGSTTTLSATSTSGGSTTVNAYRVNLTRGPATASATSTLDSVSASTYRIAKYHVQVSDDAGANYEFFDVNVSHNGTTAYTSTFGNTGTTTNLITISADIDSGNLRLRGTINNTNDHVVKVVRRVVKG